MRSVISEAGLTSDLESVFVSIPSCIYQFYTESSSYNTMKVSEVFVQEALYLSKIDRLGA